MDTDVGAESGSGSEGAGACRRWLVRLVFISLWRAMARLVVGCIAVLGVVVVPAVAQAVTPPISGVTVTGATSSSFTVSLDSLGSGWSYKVFASTTKSQVFYANLASAPYQSAASPTPQVALSGLPYTIARYWFRVQATSGTSQRTGDILSVGLLPSTPTSLAVGGSAHHGTWLTWSADAAGSVVQQATNDSFSTGARSYTTRSSGHQFTPGTRYYFRVRASNYGTLSDWSGTVSAVAGSTQPVRIGTYNVTENTADGTSEGGNTIAPWSQRVSGVAGSIKASGASVVGVQEAAGWVGPQCTYLQVGTRQADDLVAHLGAPWSLAVTEVRPCLPGWARTGVYIAYDSSKFTAVGDGGKWNIGTSTFARWAVYQQLRSAATGAQFLFVTPHLIVGSGATNDQARQDETTTMINDAQAYAAGHGDLPIIYAGDFNSNELHNPDGPAIAMRAADATDALLVAQTLVNAQYNSANGYQTTPPADGHSIDHIYGAPGIAIASWKLVLQLTNGSFVGVIPSDHNLLTADTSYPY